MLRGADVTLVTGQTSIEKPRFVNIVPIESAREMFEEVTAARLSRISSSRQLPWPITVPRPSATRR